jgi:probable addiction module antidote protein
VSGQKPDVRPSRRPDSVLDELYPVGYGTEMARQTPHAAQAAYLNAALQNCDFGSFIEGVAHIARAQGISSVANATGLGRESLYKSLARDSKPRFETICKVMQSIGLKLIVVPDAETE